MSSLPGLPLSSYNFICFPFPQVEYLNNCGTASTKSTSSRTRPHPTLRRRRIGSSPTPSPVKRQPHPSSPTIRTNRPTVPEGAGQHPPTAIRPIHHHPPSVTVQFRKTTLSRLYRHCTALRSTPLVCHQPRLSSIVSRL